MTLQINRDELACTCWTPSYFSMTVCYFLKAVGNGCIFKKRISEEQVFLNELVSIFWCHCILSQNSGFGSLCVKKERTWHRGVSCSPRRDLENWLTWLLELAAYFWSHSICVCAEFLRSFILHRGLKRNPACAELILCSEFYQIGSCTGIYFLVDVNF